MRNKQLMKIVKKILIVLAIIVLIANVISLSPFNSKAFADTGTDDVVDGVAGIILFPAKFIPLIGGRLIDMILAMFSGNGTSITLGDILFNKIEITKIDFFNFNSSSDTVNSIRAGVATWYYAFRNIAAVLLLGALLYTGLRMALANVSSEKAKYSEMLVNWIISVALLFVLHYLMMFIIYINNAFVNIFSSAYSPTDLTEPMDLMFNKALTSIGLTKEIGYSLCYVVLIGMTFVFLLSYLRRMVTIAFLIVISPLVTITYSVDKMRDGKSQALNTWFKEFTYNVLIQPFHCLSYLFLAETGFSILSNEKSIAAVVVATMMVYFMYQSEKIVKHIFHFENQTMADTVKHAAFVSTAMGTFSGLGVRKGNRYSNLPDPEDDEGQTKNNEQTVSNDVVVRPSTRTHRSDENNNDMEDGQNENEQARNEQNTLKSNEKLSNQNKDKNGGQKGNSRVRKAISSVMKNPIVSRYYAVNKTIGKMILNGGLALSTGNFSTMVAAGTQALADGVTESRENTTIIKQNKMQNDYEELEKEKEQELIEARVQEEMHIEDTSILTEDEIKRKEEEIRTRIRRNEGKGISKKAKNFASDRMEQLANGAEPKDEKETKVQKNINGLRASYANQGMDEEKVDKQIKEDLDKVQRGEFKNNSKLEVDIKNAKGTATDIAEALTSPSRDIKKFRRRKNRFEQ